jgi:hypothetical protein
MERIGAKSLSSLRLCCQYPLINYLEILSRERVVPDSNFVGDLHEYKTGERKTTVAKTVQYWFNGKITKIVHLHIVQEIPG